MRMPIDGRDAYAYTGGQPFAADRPVVVFIHGAQNDHSVWALQSRYLAHHGHAVLAVDLPGHGRSDGPALTSVEDMAGWVLRWTAAVGATRAVLVGHSMGSLIAIEAASRHDPTVHVNGVVAIATAWPMPVSDALLDATAHDEARAIDLVSRWSSDTAHGGFSQKQAPGFGVVWGNRRLMERQPAGTMHTDFTACNAYRNGGAAAAAIACPALFVLGERDAMTPAKSGLALARLVRDGRVVVLPKIGHAVMAEAPDATLDALLQFLPMCVAA